MLGKRLSLEPGPRDYEDGVGDQPALELFVQAWWRAICGRLGLVTLRALSLGRYPPREPSLRQLTLCSALGLVLLVAFLATLFRI